MQSKTVLIVGGAGYVGSHVNKLLGQKGYRTVVFDNLSRGNRWAVVSGDFVQGDLDNRTELAELFLSYEFDAIMHFAALTDVGESTTRPARYYKNNVVNTINLLDAAIANNIKTLVFSSSAAIFGLPHTNTIAENHPCLPINPYGRSKLMVEEILSDYDAAYGLKSSCLRYFNACGSDPENHIPSFCDLQKNLIPLIFQSIKTGKPLTIYGDDYPTPDGTCVRDYIHVQDLAVAHLLCLEKLLADKTSSRYNLGNGRGYSVNEVLAAVEKVTDRQIKAVKGPRRPGDPPTLLANSEKAASELQWKPQYHSLESMISHAWKSYEL
jgi:UDP-glucose 4-epimerase